MDIKTSFDNAVNEHAVWQYFEGYNPPAEEFQRLAEHFEQLVSSGNWSFEDVLKFDDQICRILERLNPETACQRAMTIPMNKAG